MFNKLFIVRLNVVAELQSLPLIADYSRTILRNCNEQHWRCIWA